MKKKNTPVILSPYHEYLDFLDTKGNAFKIKDHSYYLERYSLFKNIIDSLPCFVYILNFKTRNYLFVSEYCKTLGGFTPEEIMTHGVEGQLARLHPDDLAVYSNDVFKKFRSYSHSLSQAEMKNIRFSLNYRFKRKDGIYIKAMQQYVILERDEENDPILLLGIATDITAHKTDNKMIFAVTKYNEDEGYEVVMLSDSFTPGKLLITKREHEILKLMATKHYSSKKIADELHISFYTVKAHRRNLLEKTGCTNTPALVEYALVNGLA